MLVYWRNSWVIGNVRPAGMSVHEASNPLSANVMAMVSLAIRAADSCHQPCVCVSE